jgi:lysophospholipase L1-like esterase
MIPLRGALRLIALRGALRRSAFFFIAAVALAAGAAVALQALQPAASATSSGWVETWAAAPIKATRDVINKAYVGFSDSTVRNVVFTSVGGSEVRIRLSNVFGTRPLDVGQASVGEVASEGSLAGPAFPVTFNNGHSVVVPVGEEVLSDPIPMSVSPLEDIAVSIYLPIRTGPTTYHLFGQQDSYLAPGNHVDDISDVAYPTRTTSWYFLDVVDVMGAYKRAGVVVAFGDSITDGVGSSDGTNGRWPDFLARRLDGQDGNEAPAVIDEGIGGNRVLSNSACFGQSALARFSRDVLDQPGVRDVIVLEGVNDIGYSSDADIGCEAPNTDVSAAQIINGYKMLIADAHAHGVRIFGCTLTPFGSSWFWSVEGQAKWRAINHWIRTSGAFDGVFDFARAISDPRDRNDLNPADDSGDGLHPNDAGYAAMANSINLNSLTQ